MNVGEIGAQVEGDAARPPPGLPAGAFDRLDADLEALRTKQSPLAAPFALVLSVWSGNIASIFPRILYTFVVFQGSF